MWPWEAAAFGYLCYSFYCHVRHRTTPGGWAVLVVAVGSVVPDLVDKPLDWQFGVFRSGYALGHSLLVGVPVAYLCYRLARRRGVGWLGTAFGVGVLSHDLGDALEHAVEDGSAWFGLEHALWPIYRIPDSSAGGFSGRTLHLLSGYLHDVLTLHPTPYLALVSVVVVVTGSVWLYDGHPGLRELRTVCAYPFAALRR